MLIPADLAERLGFGSWRLDGGILEIEGAPARRLGGSSPLRLEADALAAITADRSALLELVAAPGLAVSGETASQAVSASCRCTFRTGSGEPVEFLFHRLAGEAPAGIVQAGVCNPPSHDGTMDGERLERDLARLGPPTEGGGDVPSTVLLHVHIEQFATIEQAFHEDMSLIETVGGRLADLADFAGLYHVREGILAVLFRSVERLRTGDCIRRVQSALREPLRFGGRDHHLVVTIGAAAHPRQAATGAELAEHAGTALDYARRQGWRGRHAVFTRRMANEIAEWHSLEIDILQALAANQLELRYQPIIDLANRRIGGVEVLMRWKHPQKGYVRPDIFIPLAERLGLIQPFTEWLIGRAARELVPLVAGRDDLRINVNLSARQAQPVLIDALLAEIDAVDGIDCKRFTFEVTEGVLLENSAPALEALERLRRRGVRIALDDFGTGFSSISYLGEFPIDVIKIDKSFVQKIDSGGESRKLVEAMLFMASAFELDCVAEGVEQLDELAWLATKGCRYIQGYYFARPLDRDELAAFLTDFVFPEDALAEALWPKARGLPRLLSDNQEEALKLFVKHVPMAVAMFDAEMRYLVASDRWLKDYELEGDIVGRFHYDVQPEIPRRWRDIHARGLAGTIESCEQDPYVRPDGRQEWLRWEVRPFHDSFGGVQGIIIFSELVTGKVEADQALKRQTRQLELAGEIARLGYWRLDLSTGDMFWSPEMYRFAGCDPATFEPTRENRAAMIHEADRAAYLENWNRAIASEGDFEFQVRIDAADGGIRHMLVRGMCQKDGDGRPVAYFGMSQDITQQIEHQIRLKESEERLAGYLETASDWFWETGADLRITSLSTDRGRSDDGADPAAEHDRVTGHTWWELAGSDLGGDSEPAHRHEDMLAHRPFRDFEYSRKDEDGVLRHYSVSGKPIFAGDGTFAGYRGTARDITARVEVEKDLERRAAQMGFAGELAKLAHWRESLANRRVEWSSQLYRMIGRRPEDFTPTFDNRFSIYHADDRARVMTTVLEAASRGDDFEITARILGAAGEERHVVVRGRPEHDARGRLTGFFGIMLDVTEIYEAQQALSRRENENSLFRQMIESIPDPIFAKGLDGALLYGNRAALETFAEPVPPTGPNCEGRPWLGTDAPLGLTAGERAVVEAGRSARRECQSKRPDGSLHAASIVRTPLRDEKNEIIGLVRLDRDITEERLAKQTIVESEQRFRALVTGSLQSIAVFLDDNMVFANDSYCHLLGYAGADAALADCQPCWLRQGLDTHALLRGLCARAHAGEVVDEQHRIEIVRVDGHSRWAQVQARSIVWDGVQALQLSLLDVTQLVEQTRKMVDLARELFSSKSQLETAHHVLDEAIGALSDGIALFDADDRLILCNRAFAESYGVPSGDLAGWSMERLVDAYAGHNRINLDTASGHRWRERRLAKHRAADGTPVEMRFGDRWYVARTCRGPSGRTVLLRSDVTHLKRTENELNRLLLIDPVTQLYNRQAFQSRGTRLIGRCRASGEPVSLMLVDIVGLASINERFGESAGDRVLRFLGDLCREMLRPEDLVGRWSGDEVAILLPTIGLDDIELVRTRLETKLAERQALEQGDDLPAFKVSIGVASPKSASETLDRLVARTHIATGRPFEIEAVH
ncbi:MAG: EAL domain-containing protein [Geminicoccaceae bacterium]